ncbi:MAG: hypothetical protein M9954_09070 [Cyclobacteriaceae bacterium]|nr:hypothetical protein [Cyclobacteriaceae bacterium]
MVEVFSTNVSTEKQAKVALMKFKRAFPHYQINFDLEDCDNILRVEFEDGMLDYREIIAMIQKLGFSAVILPD